MTTTPAQPFFFAGPAGDLFALYYPPHTPTSRSRHDVVLVPPFAEEMNKSRRMLALQARALNALGYGVLMFDFYGTGDSQGDFGQATLDIWRGDLRAAHAWLGLQGAERISVLALRFGALLAMELAHEAGVSLESAVLWQPVVSGEGMMTQFLRLRVAAGMMGSGVDKESTQGLRAQLAQGEFIEVAGYTLAPALVTAIDALQFAAPRAGNSISVEWLDMALQEDRPLSPASQRMVDSWRSHGVDVRATVVVGEPFWSSPEITLAPKLLQTTSSFFRERVGS